MDQCIINPTKGKKEPTLPGVGVLAVNPADSHVFPELAKKYSLKKAFLFHSKLYYSDRFFLAGPAIGAPMAAMCLEKLIALGAQKLIVYGWCGSLQPSLRVGEVLVPDSGISEEGTSEHYMGGEDGYRPDPILKEELSTMFTRQQQSVKSGPMWTTDAPYRETREKVHRYREAGVYGVDMEYTALCSVAAFRKVALAACMLVSDELYHPQWRPHYGQKSFLMKSVELLRSLCEEIDSNRI